MSSRSFTETTPVSINIFNWAKSPLYAATCAGKARSETTNYAQVNDIHFLHILCITTREIIMYTWRLEAILLAALTEIVPHVNLVYMFYYYKN